MAYQALTSADVLKATRPVRVNLQIAVAGKKQITADIVRWLNTHVGQGKWDLNAQQTKSEATELQFECISDANHFMKAFPDMAAR